MAWSFSPPLLACQDLLIPKRLCRILLSESEQQQNAVWTAGGHWTMVAVGRRFHDLDSALGNLGICFFTGAL